MKMPLNVDELQKSNILVTGGNQQGKSRLAMSISDKLMKEQWQILVFDNVGHWKSKSSIPHYLEVSENNLKFIIPKEESIIYDISRLLPVHQKEFVEVVLAELWNRKLDGKMPKWTLIVTEESQLYLRNLRSLSTSQHFMRIFSVGANHGIRCLAITPTLVGIDPEFIRLTQQRYHFRESNEIGAKRRFKGYYGGDWQKVAQELDVGFCIYYLNGNLAIHGIPLFHSPIKSEQINIKPIVKEAPKPQQRGLLSKFFSLFMTQQDRIAAEINRQQSYTTFGHQDSWEERDEKEWNEWLLDEEEWET